MHQNKEKEGLQPKMNNNSKRKEFAARFSIISNTILTLVKILAGIFSGSVGVVSEAIHSGIDLAASVIAYFSIKVSGLPEDDDHNYGHGKFEDVSGLAEAILILLVAIIIFHEAYVKLASSEKYIIHTDFAILIMIFATIANFVISRYLFKVSKETDSIALYADAQHLSTDVITSLGVLGSLLVIKFTGFTWIDPVIAILISLFITYIAVKIIIQSIKNLVDIALPKEEELIIRDLIKKYSDEIINLHGFRSRKSGNMRFIDFHLTLDENVTIKHGHILCDLIEEDINKEFPNTKTTIHLEPCDKNCAICNMYNKEKKSCID